MSWEDRLLEAAYTSPSGIRLRFDYEDVSRSVEKKTSAFEFPDADGTYIQDLGRRGRRYPLRVIFWGENYDQAADLFEALLLEVGVGKLEHPVYGTIDVVPFGEITRQDALKNEANQATVEVVFFETIGLVYPTAQTDPGAAVLSALDAYNATASEQFDRQVDLGTIGELTAFKNQYLGYVRQAKDGLQSIANMQQDVRQQFDGIVSSIQLGIDTLVSTPLNLAFQTVLMIEAPARALTDIGARLRAYGDLAVSLLTSGSVATSYDNTVENNFHARDLFASTYVGGAVLSAVNAQFDTKAAALTAASQILDLFDQVAQWRDGGYAALGEVDTGEAYQQMQSAVALAAGYLVAISFTLKQERRITLDRPRSLVELVAELYGSVDDRIDFFILSNALTGSEILELPRGRRIVYYA